MTTRLPPSLFRFVAVRRATPLDAPLPPPPDAVIDKAFDFSDQLLPAAATAIRGGDRLAAARLAADLVAEASVELRAIAARLQRAVLMVTINEALTLGDLRQRLGSLPPPTAQNELAGRAASAITLAHWLGRDGGAKTLRGVLRGVALARLCGTNLDGAYRMRDLLKGRALVLPPAPPAGQSAAMSRSELVRLQTDVRRVSARSSAIGRGADPTLAELAATPIEDLRPELERMAEAGKRLGVAPLAPASTLFQVLDAEVAASSPATALAGGSASGGAAPPSVPALDAWARVLGRGDLMIVRSEHLRYELGEIAFVENVLRSELRGRTIVVDTATSERIVETSNLFTESSQELATTERSDLQDASNSAQTAATTLSTGMNVSGGLGPVNVGLDVNASQSTSTTQSNSSATSYAREVTDRATETMRSEASTRTVTTNRSRFTETDKHEFDNRQGADHVRGIYRWLDKVDLTQVYNYGERLLLEFIVPEPAAQYVYLATTTAQQGEPVAPQPLDFMPKDITEHNFVALGLPYDATSLERPPPQQLAIAASFSFAPGRPSAQVNPDANTGSEPVMMATSATTGEVKIPDGYAAGTIIVTVVWGGGVGVDMGSRVIQDGPVSVCVGGQTVTIAATDAGKPFVIELTERRTGNLPVALGSQQIQGQAIAMRVIALRTSEAFTNWQHATFAAIQQAYLGKLGAYNSALSVAQLRQGYAASTPADVNRGIEIRELTRGCQTILTGQDFDLFGALDVPGDEIPRIDIDESLAEADTIAFFSDVFDWALMTYYFYAYQWAGRARWAELASRTSPDALHEAFLQAGGARVVVPVKEGFERAVARYLRDGKVPAWGPKPWRGQPTQLPAVDELIADANERPQGEVAVGEPWEVVSPTTLVYLQQDAELNPDLTETTPPA